MSFNHDVRQIEVKSLNIELIVCPLALLNAEVINLQSNVIIFLVASSMKNVYKLHVGKSEIGEEIENILSHESLVATAFISKSDKFELTSLADAIKQNCREKINAGLIFLIPYKSPPTYFQSNDGTVGSFLVFGQSYARTALAGRSNFEKIAYQTADSYLNSDNDRPIRILQVGKAGKKITQENRTHARELEKALLIIPHKGSIKLLNRCLLNLKNIKFLPQQVNICFDDMSFRKIVKPGLNLGKNIFMYVNSPKNVGPYLGRHYSILNTKQEFIFFHDSDDISVEDRFIKQIHDLKDRKLDLLGSHELRIDQIAGRVVAIRYPLDVSFALSDMKGFNSLFHPTSVISRKAYLKTGGFSTDLRFGYDSQFLLRSQFFLRIGNIDDFLYIRYKRPNSLTTNPATRIGSNLRTFLLQRWITDFRLINENKLNLQESSLKLRKHTFDFKMLKVLK
jgi:hypothetical protein